MLVPDGIFVYDEHTVREGRFPASFTAVDDPNQNPERPKGFLWLKLDNTIDVWKKLCYERITQNGGRIKRSCGLLYYRKHCCLIFVKSGLTKHCLI